MIKINLKVDTSKFDRRNAAIRQQQPFATAYALTKTAQFVQRALRTEMESVFRSPVPFTLNAIRIAKATKQSLLAIVAVKDQTGGRLSPLHWLTTEIQGGQRNIKALEKAFSSAGILPSGWVVVPAGGAKLDSYGNVSSGQINQIITQLRNAVGSTLKRKYKGQLRSSNYFVVQPSDAAASRMAPGIYSRSGHTSRRAVFIFMANRPAYGKRFDFFGLAERTARERFPIEFDEAMRVALASAR